MMYNKVEMWRRKMKCLKRDYMCHLLENVCKGSLKHSRFQLSIFLASENLCIFQEISSSSTNKCLTNFRPIALLISWRNRSCVSAALLLWFLTAENSTNSTDLVGCDFSVFCHDQREKLDQSTGRFIWLCLCAGWISAGKTSMAKIRPVYGHL